MVIWYNTIKGASCEISVAEFPLASGGNSASLGKLITIQ